MATKRNLALLSLNIIILSFGCALIGIMWIHQNVQMGFYEEMSVYEDASLPPGFHFFLSPYFGITYLFGIIALIGKELFVKKSTKAKILINLSVDILLVLLLSFQMLLWQHAIIKFGT